MTSFHTNGEEHLSPELVAAYLDRELTAQEADRVAGHLAACDRCREELIEVRRLMSQPAPARPGRRVLRFLVPAAAAAAAVALFAVPGLRDGGDVTRGEGGPSADAVSAVSVIGPLEGPVPGDALRFEWHAAGEEALYTLAVTDATGAVVWTAATADTTAALPPSVRLSPGSEYFWYVDAQLSSGETTTSGVQRFETAP